MRGSWCALVGGAVLFLGCATEAKKPFDGVLHAMDSGIDMTDSAMPPMQDGATADTAVVVEDAGVDSGVDAGVDAGPQSPLLGLDATNMPNALVEYGGAEPSPGLTFLATHLELDPISTSVSVDFYARVRNDFSETLCAFAVDITLLDSSGFPVLPELSTLADMRPHVTSNNGLYDCASPGEEFYLYATDFVDFASDVRVEDVSVIEWVYALGGYLTVQPAATRASATNLAVVPGTFSGFMLTGRIHNNTTSSIGFPNIAAYVLNRGGQPLARLYDITTLPIAGLSDWSFETGSYAHEFTPLDLDTIVGYQLP